MNEWLKNLLGQVSALWGKWSLVQKIALIGTAVALVAGLILVVAASSAPSRTALLGSPLPDDASLRAITAKLDLENVDYSVTEDRRIYVKDLKTAQNMRSILVRENLIPRSIDPWALLDVERWTITDFERNVNLRRAVTANLEQHIRALDDIDDVSIILDIPEESLFAEDQKAVTASVRLSPKPGSDLVTNRKKIEGIERLILLAVSGLQKQNISITDGSGLILNDFAGLESLDRLELTKREMQTKADFERRYKQTIFNALRDIYTPDRVRIVNLDITLNTDKTLVQREEHFPIVMEPDNPRTPFSERRVVESITLSENERNVQFRGTGFNPEGPPGQEGQTPPAYKDLSNLVGEYSDTSTTRNQVVNRETSTTERSPWAVARVTLGVALDGRWERVYNEAGEIQVHPNGSLQRNYLALTQAELNSAKAILEAAVGFNRDRGDVVTVEHIPFDRTSQFQKEDDEYRAAQQFQRTLFWSVIGLLLVLIAFVGFRLVSREMERRRRLKEEELARQHQMMREKALQSAEEEGVDVEMSVAERARLELQETAINMAREHPADVAQLIRTWLAEE